ncbi:MAG TPA: hypothetical protein PKJ84_15120, partial [Anaerolineales bacterium]|nr:hypothetical protein [Anaerolineales bacterium]
MILHKIPELASKYLALITALFISNSAVKSLNVEIRKAFAKSTNFHKEKTRFFADEKLFHTVNLPQKTRHHFFSR